MFLKHFTRTKTILFLITINFIVSISYAKDISVSRTQAWTRLQLNTKIHENGIGVLFMAGNRYNVNIDKQIDNSTVNVDPQGAWLQELWIGPTYNKQLSPKTLFTTNLVYRPQWWYLDGAGGEGYIRNTIANTYTLSHKLNPKAAIFSRLMLWDHLPAQTGEDKNLQNELYIRPLVGLRLPLCSRFELMLDEEIYLKPTADAEDIEGKEFFYRNAIWAGGTLKVSINFKVTLNYVNMWTNLANTSTMRQRTTDHYIFLNAAWNLDFSSLH